MQPAAAPAYGRVVRGGDGLLFADGVTPTSVRFLCFQLEKQAGSKVWPLALFLCVALQSALPEVEQVFGEMVSRVRVGPAAPAARRCVRR